MIVILWLVWIATVVLLTWALCRPDRNRKC